MLFMKNFIMTISLLCFGTIALAGNGSSGGGQGIITPDGKVHLLDLLDSHELPERPTSEEQIKEMFYKKKRYIKTVAIEDDSFFDCAKNILNKYSENPIFNWISHSLDHVRVFKVDARFYAVQADFNFNQKLEINLPYFSYASETYPIDYQTPLATYNKGHLWISKRIYEALPEQDKCALSVHESFRYLNDIFPLREYLLTDEIEHLVRKFFDHSYDEKIVGSAMEKLTIVELDDVDKIRSLSEIRKEINIVNVLIPTLSVSDPQRESLEKKVSELEAEIWDRLELDIMLSSTDPLQSIGDQMDEIINKLADPNLSDEEIAELQNKSLALRKTQRQIINEFSKRLIDNPDRKMPDVRNFGLLQSKFEEVLFNKLPIFRYYDSYANKLVRRLF